MLKPILLGILILFNIANAEETSLPILSGVGGEFTAIDVEGNTIESDSFTGSVVVLAFGYTNCADICPLTLGYLKRLYAGLTTNEQTKSRIVFVTIDPEYDTPGHLKKFIGHYNKDFVGLSGSQAQIDYIVSLYQAQYKSLSTSGVATQNMRRVTPKKFIDPQEAKDDKASLFSHTITLYLLDKQGNTRSLEYTGTPIEQFVGKIRALINE